MTQRNNMLLSILSVGILCSFKAGTILGYSITLSGNAISNQPLRIHMNIGTINTVVVLTRPDGSTAGTCLAPLGGVSGGCGPGLTQDLTNGITTCTIPSVSRVTDQGVWRSEHGVANGNINISVISIPTVGVSQAITSIELTPGTINSEMLVVDVTCAYPGVSINLAFVEKEGGATLSASSSTSTCASTGNTGCTDTDANSYTCTITPQYEAALTPGFTYFIEVMVNLEGVYIPIGLNDTITDTEINVNEGYYHCIAIIEVEVRPAVR